MTSRIVAWSAFVLAALALAEAEAQAPSASASGKPAATPQLRSLEKQPPPELKSEAPKADEWKDAEPVALLGALPEKCRALLLREWLQIRCDENGGALSIVSGSGEGVTAFLIPPAWRRNPSGVIETVDGHSTLQLPIRRGDRRILQVSTIGVGDYGSWANNLYVLSVQWLDDQPGPWIVVSNAN